MVEGDGSLHICRMSHPTGPLVEAPLSLFLILDYCRFCRGAQICFGHTICGLDNFQTALNDVQNAEVGNNTVDH